MNPFKNQSRKNMFDKLLLVALVVLFGVYGYKLGETSASAQWIRFFKRNLYSPYILTKINDVWIAGVKNDYTSEMVSRGKYEQLTTLFLKNHVKSGETVVELGANIGYYTTLLAKIVGENGKVYSYEANKEVFELATLALKMNDLHDRVHMKNVAVTDKTGIITFCRYTVANASKTKSLAEIGMSHIKRPNDSWKEEIQVPTVTLDTDLPDLRNVDWLRMDIEGSEILALKGMKRIIETSPNLKIVMEWNLHMLAAYGNVEELIDEMHKYGFKFYEISASGKLGRELKKDNLLNQKIGNDVALVKTTNGLE